MRLRDADADIAESTASESHKAHYVRLNGIGVVGSSENRL